jgi:hypothetical protein
MQKALIRKIQNGRVTLVELNAAGAVQVGLASNDLASVGCPNNASGCVDIYAVSIPGVVPATYLSWFQAVAAARNSLKRLATNQEWQAAALGTPDTGGSDNGTTTCNTDDLGPGFSLTGARWECVSDVGAFDMVGNAWERVADWSDVARGCENFSPDLGSDLSCFGDGAPGSGGSHLPGTVKRGGQSATGFLNGGGTEAGVFAVDTHNPPSLTGPGPFPGPGPGGFRAVR